MLSCFVLLQPTPMLYRVLRRVTAHPPPTSVRILPSLATSVPPSSLQTAPELPVLLSGLHTAIQHLLWPLENSTYVCVCVCVCVRAFLISEAVDLNRRTSCFNQQVFALFIHFLYNPETSTSFISRSWADLVRGQPFFVGRPCLWADLVRGWVDDNANTHV